MIFNNTFLLIRCILHIQIYIIHQKRHHYFLFNKISYYIDYINHYISSIIGYKSYHFNDMCLYKYKY